MKANVTNKLNKVMNASVLRMQQIYRHQLVVCLYKFAFNERLRSLSCFVLSLFNYIACKEKTVACAKMKLYSI